MDAFTRNAQELFHITLTEGQLTALAAYERELLDWNQKFNLTAIRDSDSIRTKHFLDSFSCTLAWGANPPHHLIDVGTGAGFPGLPLKILYPSLKLTLVESVGKKANFCEHIIKVLGLQDVEVIKARAEDVGQMKEHREKQDWAVARAVADMKVLAEYLLPLLKIGGTMLAQKGESAPVEAQSAEKAIKLLGGKLKQVIPIHLRGVTDDRYLVLVDKVAVTPPKYPRKAGTPVKQPL
ncbi:MAG TPA: 16S rRNA (guanine(527)-N(7))-methyltransferase RsmG [Anaerolineales bacterium]|jgi:16S rRNA (guanine527-N7)-methyltransferase|nr:16S rRNA (guanine(527)-N(7))-methyltransferase RsmG [Anaerolineales bacterium]